MPNPPVRTLRRWRSLALKCAIFGATSVGCLLLAEWGARLIFPQFHPAAQLAFRAMPGHFALGPPLQTEWDMAPKGDFNVPVKFNQYGFRDVKDLREAAAADWFAVGDSFTLGFGVDEEKRFSNLLEQKFQAQGRPARIFNIAIPGNFIDYQRLVNYAQSRGAKINHMIIGVCMANDLMDYTRQQSDWEMMPRWQASAPLKDKIRGWMKAHSALYITASFVLESSPGPRRFLEKIGVAGDLVAMDAAHQSYASEATLKSSRDELVKLAALAPDSLILIIPTRRVWLGDQKTERQLNLDFVQLCRAAGLKVVDLMPVFDQDPNPLSFYFAHDPHWSPRGHEVAAAELFKALPARTPDLLSP